MGEIIKIIEQATSGVSFNSFRYSYDTGTHGPIDYDDNKDVIWKEYGETDKLTEPVNLKNDVEARYDYPSIFSFFLDGSRHTYKIDDMSFGKNVYPILAGQVGVGCCERVNKTLKPAVDFEQHFVLAVPDKAFSTDWDSLDQAKTLLQTINKRVSPKGYKNFKLNDILLYDTNKDEKFEKKGIAKIQDYMIEREKQLVANLTSHNRLDEENYLIKDGSLDYQSISEAKNKNALNLSDQRILNNYRRVIGVSKSFDPTKCQIQGGGTNSNVIAKLNVFERTPAYRYTSSRAKADFCIWYIRVRDAQYTNSIFDGVLKIEKLIVTEAERVHGIATADIDNISAFLLNERNPVCYGADERWANHLYPIYVTEQYIKSKYLNSQLVMRLF